MAYTTAIFLIYESCLFRMAITEIIDLDRDNRGTCFQIFNSSSDSSTLLFGSSTHRHVLFHQQDFMELLPRFLGSPSNSLT